MARKKILRLRVIVDADNYTEKNEGPHVPGKYRTLAEAKRGVDEELKKGVWL